MTILALKAVHVISMVIWLGVLLYMPRLLVLLYEANTKKEPDRDILTSQYKLNAHWLWNFAWIGMLFTILFGLGLMHHYFSTVWFWVKMAFVLGLTIYHHILFFTYKSFRNDHYKKTPLQLQTMGRTAFLLMVGIILLAVLKDHVDTILIGIGIVVLIVLVFMIGRIMVKKAKAKKAGGEKPDGRSREKDESQKPESEL